VEVFTVQIGNSGPAFGFLGMNKKDEKTKAHGTKHAHHAGHKNKHKAQFGAITGSSGVDSFQKR
jgi:hypothetical protein